MFLYVDKQARLIPEYNLPQMISTLQILYTFRCFLVQGSSHVMFTILSDSVPKNGWTILTEASDSSHTDVALSLGAQVDLQDTEVRNVKNTMVRTFHQVLLFTLNGDTLLILDKPSNSSYANRSSE